jgi:hypothetical protein
LENLKKPPEVEMVTPTLTPIPAILPEVMSKVGGMGPASLQALHRFIHLMELNALVEDIKDDADSLRISGKLNPGILDAAIREHRLKHG